MLCRLARKPSSFVPSSVLPTARMTGADKETVPKLLVDVVEFCSTYQHHVLRKLPCTRVEADEIWLFVGA